MPEALSRPLLSRGDPHYTAMGVLADVVQSLGRTQLCDPMDCSTPGFRVLHYLSQLAPTHVHGAGDAMARSIVTPILQIRKRDKFVKDQTPKSIISCNP